MIIRSLPCLFPIVVLLASSARAADETTLDDQLVVPAGLTVTLAAESPLLFNPTAIDVDHRGRLWVTEAVNYRKWGGRNPGRDHPEGDRVVVLSDDDGDGVYDRSTVFAQDEELVSPLGIAVFGNRVIVSCSPNLLVYTDDDGDDVADRREVLLTGFGGFDHDHGLHSVVAGPDGRWWLAAGNAGPHLVTDKAGFRLRSGSIYTGGGPVAADNKPGLVSDDGRAYTGGLVLSMFPDGTGLSVYSHNFRNEYEVALDAFGDAYTADNDDDGNRGCRTVWCLEGGDHGYFSADGSRTWGADRRPGQDTQTAHWHADDPGVVPSHTVNGGGGPTGVAVYEGALLADWCGGAVLNADAGAGVVYAHLPHREGAGVRLEPGELIRSRAGVDDPGATWFRPSDVAVAPDGSVLVADWYDPGVGGHLARDREAYGRVLRIAPSGHAPSRPSFDLSSVVDLTAALVSPAPNVRGLALERLASSPTESVRHVMAELAGSPDPRHRALAAGAVARLKRAGQVTPMLRLLDLAADDDARVRLAAVRALRACGTTLPALFDTVPPGTDPAVDRELALALVPAPGTASRPHDDARLERWLALAAVSPLGDRVAVEALGLAAEGMESAAWSGLAGASAGDGVAWSPRVAEFAWRLHPTEAVPGLRARAEAAHLPLLERRRAIDALGFVPDMAAAQAMLSLALVGPDDTRELARHWVERRETDLWREHGLGLSALDGELGEADLAWSSGLVRGGLHPAQIDVTGADLLWLVATDGDDGNSCDWADWLDGRFVTDDGDVLLSTLTPLRADAAWGQVLVGRNCAGGPLRVGGEGVEGLGTHAGSVISFAVPAGAEMFSVTAAPDDGGTSQGQGVTSIVFELRLSRRPDREALGRLETVLRDPSVDGDGREDAALELLSQEGGAMVLIDLARQGVLDDELRASVGEEIFTHPDGAVRALAHELFPRIGGLAELPPLQELLALEGDVHRGRALFTDPRAQCGTCHQVRGRGGDVGPDLSRIAEKLPPEGLLDAVLNPSAGVALGYEGWMVTAADGRRLTGFILADGDDLLLKTSTGERVLLAADQVVERRPLSLSIMPEGVALGLEPQELADLMAFLLEDREAAPQVLGEVVLFDGSSLDGWRPVLFDEGADPADTWSIVDGQLVCEGTPIGYLATRESFTDFELELEWRFLPGRPLGNSGVLLRLNGADQVWPRSLEAQLHAGNAGDIWNIEAMDMEVDPGRTRGRRTVKLLPSNEVPHGEWNRYRITLVGDRLELEVNGELQNVADWVERVSGPIALQSEGAPIAFRNVVLRRLRR